MLTITIAWAQATGRTMNIVIIFAAVMFPIDCPNNRAEWPIPAAHFILEPNVAFTRGVLLLCAAT